MRNESSVSRFAERELRLVEPNIVSVGGRSLEGDSQMPRESERARGERKREYLWRGMSSLAEPILKA